MGESSAVLQRDPVAAREALTRCRRLVIKIGSKALAERAVRGEPDPFERLASQVSAFLGRSRAKRRAVIVSSGAIAFGMKKLGLSARPGDIAWLQAAAAAGQSALMQHYERAFEGHRRDVAQVLLTHADLSDRSRANNARNALATLLEAGVVPIVNENDAVSVEEIRFGDNDQLAALVAPLCEADVLLLLSNVEGLLDDRQRRVPFVPSLTSAQRAFAKGKGKSSLGSGGMTSKLDAARLGTHAGASVVIAAAHEPNVVQRVLAGEDVGTLFPSAHRRLSARKHWIAYTLRPRGAVILDEGAAHAITRRKSVLSVGVLGVRGAFEPGDSVAVVDQRGHELARGLTKLSSTDAAHAAGRRGNDPAQVVVHSHDLVVLPEESG